MKMIANIKENIYYNSPILLQNLFVTFYGLKLKNRRYGKNSEKYLKEIIKSERYNKKELKQYIDEKFLKIIRHAISTVPFYQEWSKKEKVSITDFRSIEDINKLPIITKEDIRNDPKKFISIIYLDRKDVFDLNTSGTSGKPLTIKCDLDSRTNHYAFWKRLRKWFGIDDKSRRATLFGRIIAPYNQKKAPFWRHDIFQRNLLMSSYHLSEENIPEYIKKLKKYQPDEIIAYPSSIYQISKYICQKKMYDIHPKVVITTAETLLENQREIIEKAFKCPVVDQYGCTEMAFFASQCEYGTMHVHPEHGWIEVLDENYNQIVKSGGGQLVATGFINYTMPIFRYLVDDYIYLSNNKCSCGRNFPVIEKIEGRIDDIIKTPDGRQISRMDPIFKGMRGIYETQIIQTDKTTIEFKIVKDHFFNKKREDELIYEIKKRVGNEMRVKINYVKEIPKSENGKFRAVISLIN
jgi:phenylacetate-CoA ligase